MCPQGHLRAALAIELGLGYMEPPRQYQPVRHCLAYTLLRAGQAQAAAEVRYSLRSSYTITRQLTPCACCDIITLLA